MVNLIRYVMSFLLLAQALCGCETFKYTEPGSVPSYSASIEKLNLDSSFAFSKDGHDYYFVSAYSEGYDQSCMRFDGYKDDQFTYSFSYDHFKELSAVYSSNQGIEQKIEKALKKIESISPRIYTCKPLPPKPKKTAGKVIEEVVGNGMAILVYGSMAIIGAPFIVVLGGSEQMAYWRVDKRLRKIRLGAKQESIAEIFNMDFKEEKVGEYTIQVFDIPNSGGQPWKRFLFVFKDKKLISYVWGLRPVEAQ